MDSDTDKSRLLVIRKRQWFRASTTVENIKPFAADEYSFHRSSIGSLYVRTAFGKGPYEKEIPSVLVSFENGPVKYPTFRCPSIGPIGAVLKAKQTKRKFQIEEDSSMFMLEVGIGHAAPKTTIWLIHQNHPQSSDLDENAKAIQEAHSWVDNQIEIINDFSMKVVGLFALIQYPLVWQNLDHTVEVLYNDDNNQAITKTIIHPADNFIPFELRIDDDIDQFCKEAVLSLLPNLAKINLDLPLSLLAKALWETKVDIRLLTQFWIIEHLANKYYSNFKIQRDSRIDDFMKLLDSIKNTDNLELINRCKTMIGNPPVVEKIVNLLTSFNIELDLEGIRSAKKLRDDLSHGNVIDETQLAESERFTREIARKVLKEYIVNPDISIDYSQGE